MEHVINRALALQDYEVIEMLPFDDKYVLCTKPSVTGCFIEIGHYEARHKKNYKIVERFFDETMNCWAGRVV